MFFAFFLQVRRKEKDQARENVDGYGKRKTRADREARQSGSGRYVLDYGCAPVAAPPPLSQKCLRNDNDMLRTPVLCLHGVN